MATALQCSLSAAALVSGVADRVKCSEGLYDKNVWQQASICIGLPYCINVQFVII